MVKEQPKEFDQLQQELDVIEEYFQLTHGASWRELQGQPCKVKLLDNGDDTRVLNGKFLGLIQSREGLSEEGLEMAVEVLGLPILYRMHFSQILF